MAVCRLHLFTIFYARFFLSLVSPEVRFCEVFVFERHQQRYVRYFMKYFPAGLIIIVTVHIACGHCCDMKC